MTGFALMSPDLQPNAMMPQSFEFNGMGCTGDNKSPVMRWSGAPAGTKSFALTAYDPDAPTGSGWWHWCVVNIPGNVTELPRDAGAEGDRNLPKGASHVRIDYGVKAWGGPCPPPGDKPHHYIFTLYALKTDKLEVPAGASPALTGFMIHANMLAKARFVARYGRK